MNLTPTEHAQLLDQLALALAEYDSGNPYHDAAPLIARARQAAEEIEREPKAEREWYAYHPEDGMELFGTSDEAKAQAALWLAEDGDAGSTDGWHEDQESLAWGYIVPVETAQVTQRHTPDEIDLVFKLRPVLARFGGGEGLA